MKNNKHIYIPIALLIISAILLGLAVAYYDFSSQIKNFHYSDKEEFTNVKEGLYFLEKMPIHFNIINQYFSNINHLPQEKKEEIVMAYVIKNNYQLDQCGPSNDIKEYLCIDKKNLHSDILLDIFHLDLKFTSKQINIYADDFGTYSIKSNDHSNYYKIVLDKKNNQQYRLYSSFHKYKQTKDTYSFYLYQGYYKGNCTKGEKLKLYDFITGKVVYEDKCNGNNQFSIDPTKKVEKLQLYKYELKKDKNNKFYLYGYNPVHDYD